MALGTPLPLLLSTVGDYEIDRSLRFNYDDYAYLNRTLADGIETGGRSLQKLQDYINRGGPIPGEDDQMIDTSLTIDKTDSRKEKYAFGMGSPFVLKDSTGENAMMTYTAEHIADMAKNYQW